MNSTTCCNSKVWLMVETFVCAHHHHRNFERKWMLMMMCSEGSFSLGPC